MVSPAPKILIEPENKATPILNSTSDTSKPYVRKSDFSNQDFIVPEDTPCEVAQSAKRQSRPSPLQVLYEDPN